jgi:hypothetical protein
MIVAVIELADTAYPKIVKPPKLELLGEQCKRSILVVVA